MNWYQDLLIPASFIGETITTERPPYQTVYQTQVIMPAPFKGYHFLHPGQLVQETTVPGLMRIVYSDQFVFTLLKTEREAGKRYKRHRLSPKEVIELFYPLAEEHQNLYYEEQYQVCKVDIRPTTVRNARFSVYGYLNGKHFIPFIDEETRFTAKSYSVVADYGKMSRMAFKAAYEQVKVIEDKLARLRGNQKLLASYPLNDFTLFIESKESEGVLYQELSGRTLDLIEAYEKAIPLLEEKIRETFEVSKDTIDELRDKM